MSRILIFIACYILSVAHSDAAIRDGNTTARTAAATQRVVSTQPISRSATQRKSVLRPAQNSQSRTIQNTTARTATTNARTATPRSTTSQTISTPRNATSAVTARATTTSAMSQTRTGAEYEQCKNAYFTCMDQFCQLKNDTYRRCSCSDRVYNLNDAFDTLGSAGEELTTFTENLDVVGMTAAQASSMKKASDGENALTSDTYASVGGKYSDLNSINISFDTANAFGTADAGQIIATYNGQNLYSAVYPQCRNAVRGDCNDASLQRAITAYLMAVEQDCNTVQTAIENKQKQMKAAVREGSAMLDLARVENRQKHNSSDFTTCLNNVESAILSEEVCGANYHKCLDNGEFIDISTGKPIAGVERFYELEQLLTFSDNVDAANQKLSKVVKNRQFVNNFESRVKKFAQPALDKCVESADDVWAEYLDKALLDIYYAQKSKVSEIKQGCFDFISTCYVNVDTGLTAAMKELLNGSDIVVQPDKIELNTRMCKDYVDSCNNMFDGDIITEYINNRKDTDRIAACRAVAKQCFDKFGGTGYQNFYYPYSGLFKEGNALDWMTLYDQTQTSCKFTENNKTVAADCYKSECAKQLTEIESCKDKDTIETVFGGFDKFYACLDSDSKDQMTYTTEDCNNNQQNTIYGTLNEKKKITHHEPRPTGVATEIYYQIVDTLSTQCSNIQGRFMELQFILPLASYDKDNMCQAKFSNDPSKYHELVKKYGIADQENMCPRDYTLNVDVPSWGACLCWENGGRRSKWGTAPTCVAALPVGDEVDDASCDGKTVATASKETPKNWCTRKTTVINQVCPIGAIEGNAEKKYKCVLDNKVLQDVPEGITK